MSVVELPCVAWTRLSSGSRFLVTRNPRTNRLLCWVSNLQTLSPEISSGDFWCYITFSVYVPMLPVGSDHFTAALHFDCSEQVHRTEGTQLALDASNVTTLQSVYTLQPAVQRVVQPVVQPTVRMSTLYSRFYNRLDETF